MISFLSSQRISVGVCSLFLLSACGGGGDSTNTSDSTTSDTGVASSVMGTSTSSSIGSNSSVGINSSRGSDSSTSTNNSMGTTSSVSNTANFSVNELVDPNPSSRVEYGHDVTVLASGNIVVSKPDDNANGMQSVGSIHLYEADTQNINVLPLGNGQFAVISPMSDGAGLEDVGAIRLFDETTGDQIGSTLVGETANYQLGRGFDTQVLSNGNFVVHSVNVDHPSSIRLINGENNTQIGSPLIEPSLGVFSRHVITPLNNGHYVLAAPSDDTNGTDTGSVKLVSGTTNQVIGDAVNGAQPEDFLGGGGVRALATGNYVVTSSAVDVGGIENAGSLQLIDGTTGARIGMPVLGDAQDDFDQATLTALDNGNFVFAAPRDDVGGIENAGSITLFDGATGAAIGQPVTGTNENAQFANRSIIGLSNNNVAIVSSLEVFGGEPVGSVRLLNGVTGQWVGGPTVGKAVEDFDLVSLTELSGNRLMIAASSYDVAGAVDAGAFITLQTNTSNTIGDPIVGSNKWDFSESSVNEAADGSFYVLTSPNAKNHGFDSAGKILVVTP